ncbi:MAG: PAS domain-containing protein [Coriobacteriia bacterium]|nr:PAS domain-containing protein [Coriobacteriia bacterium]MBN2821562.1 PAS domain-containing protein [Coriobacteriia bacterium]
MIHTISLLPLGAAIVGISLALFTSRRPRPLSRKQTFFVLLNISTALWCFGTFLLDNYAPGMNPGTFPYTDPGYINSMVLTVGVGGSCLFWFLFGAEHAGLHSWTRGTALWVASLPAIYTFVVTATNPSHHLFLSQASASAPVIGGPLAYPYLISTYAVAITGTALLIKGSWSRGSSTGHRQAIVLGAATCLPTAGGFAWQLLTLSSLSVGPNPVPALFALLQLVVVHEVIAGGLSDLLPHARAAAFDGMHDAAIVLDTRLRVITMNRAALRLFPMIEEGMPIEEYFSTLGTHARTCMERYPDGVDFEADLGGSIFWGRVRKPDGRDEGCLILLTDLTDLRSAQTELLRLGIKPGVETVRFAASHEALDIRV